jgi:uncharacterized protein (UPF0248 family)
MTKEYYIRCKGKGMRRAVLLAGAGSDGKRAKTTTLRIHASRIPEHRVDVCLGELQRLNPTWTFAAVEA